MITHRNHLDRQIEIGLDPVGCRPKSRHQPLTLDRRALLVQPAAQFPFLGPGKGHHPSRVIGALHQGERLEHRIVEMGGHLGSFLLTDPLGPLPPEIASQSHQPRTKHQGDPGGGDQRRQHDRAQPGDGVDPPGEKPQPDKKKKSPHDEPSHRSLTPVTGEQESGFAPAPAALGAVPQRSQPEGHGGAGSHDDVAGPEPDASQHQQSPEEDHEEAEPLAPVDLRRWAGHASSGRIAQRPA